MALERINITGGERGDALRVPRGQRCPWAHGEGTGTSPGCCDSSRSRHLGVGSRERILDTQGSRVCCQPSSHRRVWGSVFFRGFSYFCLSSAVSVPLVFHLLGGVRGLVISASVESCDTEQELFGEPGQPHISRDSLSHFSLHGGAETPLDGHVPVPLNGIFRLSGLTKGSAPTQREIPSCGAGLCFPAGMICSSSGS